MRRLAFILFISVGVASGGALADARKEAEKLIRLTNISEQFELARQDQTRRVIRTYASIVSRRSDYELPASVKEEISACYQKNYRWSNFEEGIIAILLENFTEKELLLLLDFYQNKGLPPTEIETFRSIVAKGDLIRKLSAEYIFAVTDGCLEHGIEAVLNYLTEQP